MNDVLENALADLWSEDPEKRLAAVEFASTTPKRVAEALVGALAGPLEGRYLAFERLGRLGSLAIEPLRRLLEGPDRDASILAASALLWMGNDEGMARAVSGAEFPSLSRIVAVRALVHARAPEAGRVINGWLLEISSGEYQLIDNLVQYLRRLDTPMDPVVRERLRTLDVPEDYLKDWFA